jgi:hypothetical protein
MGNPLTKIDPYGLIVIDGKECTEIDRKPLPSLSAGDPFHTYSFGKEVICVDTVVEDTLSCVCIGEERNVGIDLYKTYFSWHVVYRCCPVGDSCSNEKCETKTRLESSEGAPRAVVRHEKILGGRVVIKHGFTNANAFSATSDQWCSACPNGVGKPM